MLTKTISIFYLLWLYRKYDDMNENNDQKCNFYNICSLFIMQAVCTCLLYLFYNFVFVHIWSNNDNNRSVGIIFFIDVILSIIILIIICFKKNVEKNVCNILFVVGICIQSIFFVTNILKNNNLLFDDNGDAKISRGCIFTIALFSLFTAILCFCFFLILIHHSKVTKSISFVCLLGLFCQLIIFTQGVAWLCSNIGKKKEEIITFSVVFNGFIIVFLISLFRRFSISFSICYDVTFFFWIILLYFVYYYYYSHKINNLSFISFLDASVNIGFVSWFIRQLIKNYNAVDNEKVKIPTSTIIDTPVDNKENSQGLLSLRPRGITPPNKFDTSTDFLLNSDIP